MKIYHDQVIEAAYLHSKPRCFYIGPFARRVSFASQQHRALDLVEALQAKNKLAPIGRGRRRKTVAVVGAGVAGLTIASALRGQGCRVHLYERDNEPLLLQEAARHRLIHPSIARWPSGELEFTTNFSLLDWYAAPSDKVISSLRTEWNDRLAPDPKSRKKDFLFLEGVKVIDLLPHDEVVGLKVDTKRTDIPDIDYDYVFVTTGYSEEESFGSLPVKSYWNCTDDQVDKWRAEKRTVYISGCGDGGLIDALRLVHGDFDRGWLTIRLAEELSSPIYAGLRAEIIAAEDQALMAAKSLACMYLADDAGTGSSPADVARKLGARYEDNDIVLKLTAFYTELVSRLPRPAVKMLEESIQKASLGRGNVYLVSRQVRPFGPYAAPIHKIMVAHAMQKSLIVFKSGELREDKRGVLIQWISGGAGTTRITNDVGLVIRHGSPANLDRLADDREKYSLRVRQFMLADYIDEREERVVPVPRGYPDKSKPAERPLYINMRRPMVQDFVDEIVPGALVAALPDEFVYSDPLEPPADRLPLRIKLPTRVFGINLTPGELPAARLL